VIAELDALALAHQIRMASPKPDAAKWPKAGPVVSVKGTHALSCYSQAKEAIDEALALPCKGAPKSRLGGCMICGEPLPRACRGWVSALK
jgi:hypothetical protein